MIPSEKAIKIISRFEKLEAEMTANWKSHWKEISDYVLPNYDDVWNTQIAGEKKAQSKIYDTTGLQALKLLSSGLHSLLTNPSVPFFNLTTGIDELDKDEVVRDWLQKATTSMHDVLNQSNFQTQVHEVYQSETGFGTAVCFVDEDPEEVVRFESYPIYYCPIDENHLGRVDTVMRKYEWTLRKILQKFGKDSLPKEWLDQNLEKNIDNKYCIIHAVYPREDIKYGEDGNPLPGPKNMPFVSCYVLREVKHVLKESGYNEFPYLVPRWNKLPGEKYGRSPAMDALADIKMLNAMAKTQIEAAQLAVRPPLQKEDDGINSIINFTPGAINIVRPGSKGITPINTGADPRLGIEVLQAVQERIKNHFFLNQLQLAEDNPQMTATEVMQRSDEKQRILAPVLSRQHHEWLKPLVDRVFGVMLRRKLFPPIPDKLKGKMIQVQYSSMIARAQKAINAEIVTRVFSIISPLIQLKPDVLDNFNLDETVIDVSTTLGFKQSNLNKRAKVEQIRNGRIQAAQEQANMEKAQASAEVANKVQGII